MGNGSNIQGVESTQAMREALEYKVQDNGVNYLVCLLGANQLFSSL